MIFKLIEGTCWEVVFRRSRKNPYTGKIEYPKKAKAFMIKIKEAPNNCDCGK